MFTPFDLNVSNHRLQMQAQDSDQRDSQAPGELLECGTFHENGNGCLSNLICP